MADQFTYAKLPSDPCLTQEQMMGYIDGTLSVDEQHVCEKHTLDCDMCADAIEGLALVKDRAVLSTPLPSITTTGEAAGKVVVLESRSKLKIWYAAAAVLVLVLSSTFLFNKMADQSSPSVTAEQSVAFDSTISPAANNEWSDEESKASAPAGTTEGNSKNKSIVLSNEKNTDDKRGNYAEGVSEDAPNIVSNDNTLDGDNDFAGVAMEAPVDEVVLREAENEKDIVAPETVQKKASFWDKNKLGLPGVNPKSRAPEQQTNQQTLVNADAAKERTESVEETKVKSEKLDAAAPAQAPSVVGGAVAQDYDDSETPAALSDTVQNSGQGPHPLKPSDKDLDLCYTNGVSQLNARQYNTAIAFFDQVLGNKTHARFEDAEFQKANALIKLNRKEEAKTLLQSIELKKGKHAAEATALLKTL